MTNRSKVSSGIIIVLIAFLVSFNCPNTKAQASISFTPADKFNIPANNGTISFGVNGSYTDATLQKNVWTFTNLSLNHSQPLSSFQFSTQNSNATIYSYIVTATGNSNERLRYTIQGTGKQILNLDLGSQSGQFGSSDWSVVINKPARISIFLTPGKDWTISRDGTIVVNGANGNVSIVHYDFMNILQTNQPFYQQHSVAIVTLIAVVATVSITLEIKIKSKNV